ncbi:MAG: peptidyl-prolyl cis-trans isomerase [bacterium]|nr:peptidyl-prolyl cis-trans isomerase [bacterium]
MKRGNRIKCRLIAAGLAVVMAASVTGCKFGNEEVTISRKMSDDQLFIIGDEVCKVSVMKLLMINNLNLHSESYGIDLLKSDDLKVQKRLGQYVEDISMEELTRIYCMFALAGEQQIELSPDELELAQWAGEDYFRTLSDAEKEYLDITQEDLEDIYTKYAVAQKLYNGVVANVNEEVSDDEARVMRVMQIYMEDESRAAKAEAELEGGTEFISVAANYNMAENIELELTRGQLPPEVESVVFSLDNEETSPLIQTENGYYLFYCQNKFDEAATEERKADIVKQRKDDAFAVVYEPFVKTVHSKLNETALASISIDEMTQYQTADFYRISEKYLQ